MRLATTSLLLLSLLQFVPRTASGGPLSREDVEQLAQPLVEHGWVQGMVVGILDETGTRVFGFGGTSETNAAVPNGDTMFEIGSVTKAFTGMLLADMVCRGEVALDDPVQKYLPDGVKIPQIGDKSITLAHLSSHTSGLPRMPGNFAPVDPGNPYADYTPERMYAFLNECKPARKPGVGYEYSNLGAGLLGHALARRAGRGYEELLAERIFRPTGMADTRIALDDAAKARLAQGHDADGEPAKNWDLAALAGAGGIRSTASDLLKFVAAAVDPDGALAEAVALSRKSTGPGADNTVGLGWHLGRKNAMAWHNGQTGGYHSYVAFIPEKKLGVVVLAGTGTDLVDALGIRVMKRMLGESAEPIPLRKTVTLEPEALDAIVGRFALTPVFALTVTRDGDRLYCQATNQPRVRIYPESETEFFYRVVDARITFKLDKAGKAFMLTLHQNGLVLPGVRADGPPATDTSGDGVPDAAPAAKP